MAGQGSTVNRDIGFLVTARSAGGRNPGWISEPFTGSLASPPIHPHDARPAGATALLLCRGRSIREVPDRLRHKDPANTLRIYRHVPSDQWADVAREKGEVLDMGPAPSVPAAALGHRRDNCSAEPAVIHWDHKAGRRVQPVPNLEVRDRADAS